LRKEVFPAGDLNGCGLPGAPPPATEGIPDTIVQVYAGSAIGTTKLSATALLDNVTRAGYRAVMADAGRLYLDTGSTDPSQYRKNLWDDIGTGLLLGAQRSLVLGGSMPLWSDNVSVTHGLLTPYLDSAAHSFDLCSVDMWRRFAVLLRHSRVWRLGILPGSTLACRCPLSHRPRWSYVSVVLGMDAVLSAGRCFHPLSRWTAISSRHHRGRGILELPQGYRDGQRGDAEAD
jgi:hypothetical protein